MRVNPLKRSRQIMYIYRSIKIKNSVKRVCSCVLDDSQYKKATVSLYNTKGLVFVMETWVYLQCKKKSIISRYYLKSCSLKVSMFNRLTPNDPYMGRTAPLTSKRCILYTYSTNIGTEYLKHAI